MDSTWINPCCMECGSKNHLEMATGDGDAPKSKVMCASCAGKWKAYIFRRGYMIDYDEYFGDLMCGDCGEKNTDTLRIPVDAINASDLRCTDCVLVQEMEEKM